MDGTEAAPTLDSVLFWEVEYDRPSPNPFNLSKKSFYFLFVSFLEHMKCVKFNANTNCLPTYHHIKKGKACLHDGTVTTDLEPIPLGNRFILRARW